MGKGDVLDYMQRDESSINLFSSADVTGLIVLTYYGHLFVPK